MLGTRQQLIHLLFVQVGFFKRKLKEGEERNAETEEEKDGETAEVQEEEQNDQGEGEGNVGDGERVRECGRGKKITKG